MSEASDYDPGIWSGHDFASAKRAYVDHVDRSYKDAVVAAVDFRSVLEPSLTTNSPSPLAVVADVTGSMGTWLIPIFSKLGYLVNEGQEYLGKEMEICFAATGDAYSDKYPVQVRPFAKGIKLTEHLKELILEKNGGTQMSETYELAALYFARLVKTPKAIRKPILIFIGDEQPYNFVNQGQAQKYLGIKISGRLSTAAVFEELMEKFSVYVIRKPYRHYDTDTNQQSPDDRIIEAAWVELVGPERIAILPEADRVVDVIFGILAKETKRIPYFRKELKGRQRKEQFETVFRSLETIHKLPKAVSDSHLLPGRGHSVMHDDDEGEDVGELL